MFSKNLMPYYPVQTDRCGKRQNGDIRRYDSVVVRFWCILLRDDSEGIEMRTEWVDHPSFVLDHAGENDIRPLAGWLARQGTTGPYLLEPAFAGLRPVVRQ